MFVSDTNIFPTAVMKLRVSCPDGTDFIVSFLPDSKVDNLKVSVLTHILQDSAASMKESLYYKVVLVRNSKSLEDEKTLQEQDVQDNDEVLLLKRRLVPSQFEKGSDKIKAEEARRGPCLADINKATSTMPVVDKPSTSRANVATALDTELRRILISLIEVSQKLLCLNPEASKIFQQAEEILNERSSIEQADEDSVKQLADMGFPENRAKKALLLNKMSVMSAMEWLLQHGEDPDVDTPLPEQEEPDKAYDLASKRPVGVFVTPVTAQVVSGFANALHCSRFLYYQFSFKTDHTSLKRRGKAEAYGATGGIEKTTGSDGKGQEAMSPCRVSNILKSLRAYRKREFKPNQKTLQHLLEMGFEEGDCIDALRATRNDGDAACEMLISNRKPPPEDVDEGIDHDSPLFKAIMSNPVVQLGLNNPRCLLAFIQMLEHPHTANQWLSDPETAPLLVQISRIYHAEKHSDQQQKHEKMRQKTPR